MRAFSRVDVGQFHNTISTDVIKAQRYDTWAGKTPFNGILQNNP